MLDNRGEAGSEIYQLERISDDVYATVVRDGISPSQYAASLILIRTDHVLVVDSRHDDSSAEDLIGTIAGLTDLPVRYVVNTHWHGDHVQGNAQFRAQFPSVQFIGGAASGEDMLSLGRQRLDDEISRADERIAAAKQWLVDGSRTDGTPLTGAEVESLPGQISAASAGAEARRAIKLIAPGITVNGRFSLTDAEPIVEIIQVGPAHTRGDVVVHVPSRGVLAIGDLVEDGFPWFGDGFPSGWADAMDVVADIEAETILGAHGPVLHDRKMFETQHRFVRRISDLARTAAANGLDLDSIMSQTDFGEFELHFTARLAQSTDVERRERFNGFVREAMARSLWEATGQLDD